MQKIHWENFSRGFHGGRFTAAPVCVFDEGGEKCFLDFELQEYTSDEEDFFGVNTSAWQIICYIRELKFVYGNKEYDSESCWCLGRDYSRKESAMEFCEYIVESYKKHQSFTCLPYCKLDPELY